MSRRWSRCWLACCAALLLSALGSCSETATSVRVTVVFAAGLSLDQLAISVAAAGSEPKQMTVPEQPRSLQSGLRVALLLPDAWSGSETVVTVTGLSSGIEAARGQGRAFPARGEVVDITVSLDGDCRDQCPLGDRRCQGDGVSTCHTSAQGCSTWSLATPCPDATPFCSGGICAAGCKDECQQNERRCSGGGYQVCGEHDSDPCRDWAPLIACGEKELCQAGACLPSCGGKPCPCQEGETTTCADVGECRGGTRKCVGGQLGPCQWTRGPAAETCDGKDNDCDGQVDNALPPQPCDQQKGVCLGARKTCGGATGWQVCGGAEYQLAAGGAYEAVETKCDGKDNDCNGSVDEPASCCQKQCGTRVCGMDPVCKLSCGTCPSPASCNSQGQCQTGSCVTTPPEVVDAVKEAAVRTSIAVDPAGQPHIAYHVITISIMVADRTASGWQIQSANPLFSTAWTWWNFPSLLIDASGKQHLLFYEDYDNHLYYGTRASPSASWSASDLSSAIPSCYSPVASLDPTGKVYVACQAGMTAAYATNASGAWTPRVVESLTTYLEHPPSVAADANGVVHIAYEDWGAKLLRYANNSSGSFKPVTLDSTGNDQEYLSLSLAVDQAGVAHLAYHDAKARDLKYATSAGGAWKVTTVDATGDIGRHAALALDAAGHVHIAYDDFGQGDLKYATNRSGTWATKMVDTAGNVGYVPSIALDNAGTVHIAYVGDKRLKYTALCPNP